MKPTAGTRTRLAPARTPGQLRRAVADNCPGLEEAARAGDTVQAALLLREWVSAFACLATRELVFSPPDPLSAYRIMNSMAGGVWAEGCSRFFAMLLNLFSLPAATYAYSDEYLNMRHETTLVFAPDGKVYAMDAYLNFHFTHAGTGKIMDFETLITALKSNRACTVRIEESPVKRPYVTQVGDTAHNRWLFSGPEEMRKNLDTGWPGVWVYADASPSLSSLMREGLLKDVCDRCRGRLSARDFMLSLMLRNPEPRGPFPNEKTRARLLGLTGGAA